MKVKAIPKDGPNKNQNKSCGYPRMLTIKQTADTGILPEHALRAGVKEGWIPHIKSASRVYINYDKLVEYLQSL